MDLQGKKVVITGAGLRVGAALVRAFASHGAHVVIHCRHSETDARLLLDEIGGKNAGHQLWVCDLTDWKKLEENVRTVMTDASILINNASVFIRRNLVSETMQSMNEQLAVNFTAPVLMMQYFAEYAARPGCIINLLDQGICRPDEQSFSYGLSKKVLADATRAAALQLAPDIRVNGLAPGPVLPPVDMPHSRMEKTLRSIPLRRPVDLQDLCSGAVFLAENDSMTGSILFIDCGQSLCQTPSEVQTRC